jgi:hypothetical protein
MSPFQLLVILILDIPALIICIKLGNKKGHSDLGWITGLLLSWIGVVIMLMVSKTHDQEVRDARRRFRVEAEARGEVVRPEDKPVALIAAYREARNYKEES